MILEGKLLRKANPNRGRFRSLLLRSLKNFLIDANLKKRRQKRGGNFQFVSLNVFDLDSADLGFDSADMLFDVRWAETVVQQALFRLREECESTGQANLYDAFSPYLDVEKGELSYRQLAAELHLPHLSIKRLIHHFRTRFRTILRDEIRKTVAEEKDVNDEIHYLCSVLAAVASA
jgi:DNA-directed RNA polymerase specialized sigma24 family protein